MDEQAELQVPDVQSEGLVMSHDPDEGTLSDDEALGDDSSVVAGSRLQDEEPMLVLPMYSLLSSDKQALVFEAAPPGCRLCVVATNVAETSLTIPNMRYVIDTGKVKTKFYDKVTGVATFRVTWTSKASANQRAGRAGRTGPGHCYRLYSSAVFNDEFDEFSLPEISRRPVDDLVLQMKDMHIDKVINFPFPTPPDFKSLQAAEKLLITLGALEKPPPPRSFKDTKVTPSTKITPLGHTMSCFPVAPRYGKMLSLGHQHALLPYVVAMVAALSVQEVFAEDHRAPSTDAEEEIQKQRRLKAAHVRRVWAGSGHSQLLGDLMVLLKAVGAWEYGGGTVGFCEEHGLRYKAMNEIRKLRAQLTNTVNSVIPEADLVLDPQMSPPSDLQAKLLRQILLAGLTDQVARRLPDLPKGSDADEVKKRKNAYQSLMLEDAVYIHPGSVLYKTKAQYLIYQNIDETSKLYMKGVSVIESEWLPLFAANQCRFSTPADDPQPHYDPASGRVLCHMTSTFGPHYWTMPSVELEYPDGMERYKWFARCLLEGAVCTELKRYTKILLTAPITMIKSWSKLQPRTEALLNMLISESVDNTDKLRAVWHKNPTYLLKCYCDWLPQSSHKEIEDLWPPSVS